MLQQLKTAVVIVAAAVSSIVVHMFLQQQYYRMCNRDIFQVLFFRNSYFCVVMQKVVHSIERGYEGIVYSPIQQALNIS
jgi:hypothetical protein